MDFSVILFALKLDQNRIYTAPAAQGLKNSNQFPSLVLMIKIEDVTVANKNVINIVIAGSVPH